MKYAIEFDLPNNKTIENELPGAYVSWSIWGYAGVAKAKPVPSGESQVAKDTNVPANDFISRQAAINAVHEIEHIDCEGWELIDDIEECLKQLPSAEEQKKGKMTNREFLDSLSNIDFANFIYSKLLKLGKEYNDSVLGIAQWLGKENGG